MKNNKIKAQTPPIDGKCEPGATYFTVNARYDLNTDQSTPTKEEIKKRFIARFGYSPKDIFYGKPNGTLLYAGPLTRNPDSIEDRPAEDPGDLQLSLLPEGI